MLREGLNSSAHRGDLPGLMSEVFMGVTAARRCSAGVTTVAEVLFSGRRPLSTVRPGLSIRSKNVTEITAQAPEREPQARCVTLDSCCGEYTPWLI